MGKLILRPVTSQQITSISKTDYISFQKTGNLTIDSQLFLWESVYSCTLQNISASVSITPVTGSITIEPWYHSYNTQSSSLISLGTPSSSIVISSGALRATKSSISLSITPKDRIIFKVTSIGTPVTGRDLSITMEVLRL